MTLRSSTGCIPLLALLLTGAVGCSSVTGSVECSPACRTGTHCTASGCVPDGDPADLAVAGGDLAETCSPACSGTTPICRNGICVACAVDGDCPIGSVCKANGTILVCSPGCADDARCGGGSMRCCAGGCVDTARDTGNCGACGTACMGGHSSASCAGSKCMLGTCAAGWADCNGDPADGCEVNLRADAGNCTACGMACALPHALVGCAGACYIRACDYGWDDCNSDGKDGCETNVAGDIRNCGGCGVVCANAARARVGCVSAECRLLSCDPGFADCDGAVVNGCEVNTGVDANNCGACGMKCGQGLVCVQGACTCPNCNLPNAKSACVNLKCVVGSCNPGYGDCDGLPQNGCERNLLGDVSHCGSCGVQCGQGLVCTNGGCTCPQCNFANANSKCINNVCVLDSCLPGFGNCDNNPANGCEQDLTLDRNHCGACGNVCAMGLYCMAPGKCDMNPCPNPQWLASNQNWTQNNLVYASEILNNTYNPTNLLDNNLTTRWVTASTTKQWVAFDLGKVVTLSGIKIVNQANYTANAGGKDTIVQFGPAVGGPWSDVAMFQVANQQQTFQEFFFPQTQSQFWRVYVLNNWGYQSYIQFMEVGFYGCN